MQSLANRKDLENPLAPNSHTGSRIRPRHETRTLHETPPAIGIHSPAFRRIHLLPSSTWDQDLTIPACTRDLQCRTDRRLDLRLYQEFLHVNDSLVSLFAMPLNIAHRFRGLIGPARLWSAGSVIHDQIYALIAGALAPMLVFFLARRWPKSWLRNIHIPVFLNGPLYVPPGTGINYGTFIIVGFFFQYYKRRKDFAWWSKVRIYRLHR